MEHQYTNKMGFANERIAVIGGGLGRIAFMNAALYAGLRNVQLYEQAPEFAQVGAGVNISRNALLILDKYGLRDRMMRVSSHNPVLYMEYRHYRTGEYMGQVNEFAEPTARLLHRAHLLEVMKEPIPASMINKGKCLVSIERCTDGSGGYILAFKDGTKAQSDIIVGCDGIKSLVRQHLGLKDNPIYSGQMVYRGFVEYDDLPPQTAEQLRKTTNFQGPRRHVLNLPIGNDESKTARVGVIGFMTEPLEGRTSESWLAKAPVDSLDEHVKDWTGDVRKIIAALRKESTDGLMLKQALYVREPLSKWYAIRPGEIDSGIILLGDSAHSTLPHQGQGTCMAIESGFALATILQQWKTDDLDSALQFFQDFRKPRTDRITKTSYEAWKIASADIPETEWAQAFNPDMVRERMKWVMEYDLTKGLFIRGAPHFRGDLNTDGTELPSL